MAGDDVVIEFAGKTDRFKRAMREIERDAKSAAASVARSFADAEARGFSVDGRAARQQRLATEREINQRVLADRREAMQQSINAEIEGQQRLSQRTRLYTERRRTEWEDAERRRAKATTAARQITGQALTAAAGALRIGIRLAGEYADKWEYARSIMERTTGAVGKLKDGIGRDLVLAFDALAPAIEWVEGARRGFVNLYTDIVTLTPGKGAAIDAEMDRAEAMERSKINAETFSRQKLQQQARGEGPEAEKARAELEKRDYAASINALVREGKLTGNQASELVAGYKPTAGRAAAAADRRQSAEAAATGELGRLFGENSAARFRAAGDETGAEIFEARARAAGEISQISPDVSGSTRERLIGQINERRDAEIAAIEAEAAARREAAAEEHAQTLESYRMRNEEAKIDELSFAGKRREAELLRERLRLEAEIAEIKRDDQLTDEDRERLSQEAIGRSGRISERIRSQSEDSGNTMPLLQSGMVTSLTRQTVLGAGGIINIAQQQLQEQRRTNQILERSLEGSGASF